MESQQCRSADSSSGGLGSRLILGLLHRIRSYLTELQLSTTSLSPLLESGQATASRLLFRFPRATPGAETLRDARFRDLSGIERRKHYQCVIGLLASTKKPIAALDANEHFKTISHSAGRLRARHRTNSTSMLTLRGEEPTDRLRVHVVQESMSPVVRAAPSPQPRRSERQDHAA